jgi:hypothetical protein
MSYTKKEYKFVYKVIKKSAIHLAERSKEEFFPTKHFKISLITSAIYILKLIYQDLLIQLFITSLMISSLLIIMGKLNTNKYSTIEFLSIPKKLKFIEKKTLFNLHGKTIQLKSKREKLKTYSKSYSNQETKIK